MFRHFLYGLGNDLKLPKGAYYAGSSCVAALTVPPWASQTCLRHLELRAQRKIAEPTIAQTLEKGLFPGKLPIVENIMSFISDEFSLSDFHESVARCLYEPFGGAYYFADSPSDEDEAGNEEAVHAYYDGDGRGPYARADIDIVIVASSIEEARPIIEATVAKVTRRYRSHRLYETPCSVRVIGDFPQRHVQIITVLNKSLDEYLLFVDMDCTALAFDGDTLWGCPRSFLALRSGLNIVPQQMLENRSDTPRRLHKYSTRGFASLIPDPLTIRAEQLLQQARSIRVGRDGLKFLDLDWWDNDEAAIDAICCKEGRVYSETNLPRGFGITAEMTDLILSRLQARAVAQGRATCVKPFTGAPKLIFKTDKTPEIWVRWGLC